MNRLGISYLAVDKVMEYLKKYQRKSIQHIMSHYASSYHRLKAGDKTHTQYQRFLEIKEKLRAAGISIEQTSVANSGAIEQKFSLEESHIRPGLMLYGPQSTVGALGEFWTGSIVSSLRTHILDVRVVKKGTPVGYGGHICPQDGTLVILPLGYGDGVLTHYSGLKIKHRRWEGVILGRVNMDLTACLFPLDASQEIKRGDCFEFWNDCASVQSIVEQLKLIPYQLFCAVSIRVPRVYKVR